MTRGRGRQAPPPTSSEEERWLQMAESALFLYRLMDGKVPDGHPIYDQDDWYYNAAQALPVDRQLLRIVEEVARITELPPENRMWERIDRLRESQWAVRRWSKMDAVRLLEVLVERMYERREEAEL